VQLVLLGFKDHKDSKVLLDHKEIKVIPVSQVLKDSKDLTVLQAHKAVLDNQL
jgi:hypothetical protein